MPRDESRKFLANYSYSLPGGLEARNSDETCWVQQARLLDGRNDRRAVHGKRNRIVLEKPWSGQQVDSSGWFFHPFLRNFFNIELYKLPEYGRIAEWL